MKKLLVIDDEQGIINMIRVYFAEKGYEVLGAGSGSEAEPHLSQAPDIILLDIMMPGIDGIRFCEQVRHRVSCPILFLSAKTEDAAKIQGFSAGGDDFVTKPFSMAELFARVEAHLRREARARQEQTRTAYRDFWIDYGRKEAGTGDAAIAFTKKELGILELLSLNTGQTFSSDRIYERIWGYDAQGDANTAVREHVKRIRKKMDEAGCQDRIETIWGIGYRWKN